MVRAKVYAIEHEGRVVYVGITKQDLRERISAHIRSPQSGRRATKKLRAWLLTEPLYSVRVLEYCEFEARFQREQFWIGHFDTIRKGLNTSGTAGRERECSNPSGGEHYAAKRVRHVESGREFDSMAEAASALGCSVATISLHTSGKRIRPEFVLA